MSAVLGFIALALMVVVLVIAAGSLLIVVTLPLARLVQRRRDQSRGA